MREIGSRARSQPPPPHVVFEALVKPDRDLARPWLELVDDEQPPAIGPTSEFTLVTWSSLWVKRPDAVIRFDLDADPGGTLLRWTVLVDDPPPTDPFVGHVRQRMNQLINASLRYTFGQDPAGRGGTMAVMGDFDVVVGAGTRQSVGPNLVRFPHRWTESGVTVDAPFTGAHLLHLAAAGCVLNDVFREAERLGVLVRGVRVSASGEFNRETWQSTGISYVVDVDSPASVSEVEALLRAVDAVAEIPKSIRAGATVVRATREI